MGNLQGWHFIILLVIILLLFGAPRLPALARSLGQSLRIFKGEVRQAKQEDGEPAADGTAERSADSSNHPTGPAAGNPESGESSAPRA